MSGRTSGSAPDPEPSGRDAPAPSTLATRLPMGHFPSESSIPGGRMPERHATSIQADEEGGSRILQSRIQELEAQLAQRDRRIEALTDELNLLSESNDIEQHDASTQTIDRETEQFLSRFGGTITARTIVLLKLGQKQASWASPAQESVRPARSVFDAPMHHEQAMGYARKLEHLSIFSDTSAISVHTCSKCRKARFYNENIQPPEQETPWKSSLYTLNEFHPRLGKTQCCSKMVCMDCLFDAITISIANDWWFDLAQPRWIRCPRCPATLPLEDEADVINTLRYMSGRNVQKYQLQFRRAVLLRSALQALPQLPTPEALNLSAQLHHELHARERLRFFNLHQSLAGLTVEMLPVASESLGQLHPLMVPIFTSLLIKGQEPRECTICAEAFPDVTDGTPEDERAWHEAIRDFEGEFTWHLRPFPSDNLLPECSTRHALDFCRRCIDQHIQTSLEVNGIAICDRLPCPMPNCDHVYTDGQLKALTTPETFERCDQLRLVKTLSAMPNFRWCLSGHCDAGEIHDVPDETHQPPGRRQNGAQNRISCSDCGFVMCFAHQMPWHAGMSCAAYDQLEAGGGEGPSNAGEVAVQAWIEEHTKSCPGCAAPVEKRGGCFHMTCLACGFQFCWECLADWSGIELRRPGQPRQYNRLGHEAECFFRREGAPRPTVVLGNDIAEGMRGL